MCQVPKVRKSLENVDWEEIALKHAKELLNESDESRKEEMQKLAQLYSALLDQIPDDNKETVDIK